MDCKNMEQLLERYWRCETSLDEEATLRAFFLSDEVPPHLLRYKPLFAYQQSQQQTASLSEDFDAKVLALIEKEEIQKAQHPGDANAPEVVKIRRISLTSRLMPLFKAAAAVALVLTLGHVMEHSFIASDGEMAVADTIGQQISTPSVAFSEEASQAKRTQQLLDSLKRTEQGQGEEANP